MLLQPWVLKDLGGNGVRSHLSAKKKMGFVPSGVVVGRGGARQEFLIQELG